MLKDFIVSELKTMFGCTEETLLAITKKAFTYIGIYCAVMLLTFLIALSHFYILGVVAGLLLTIEIIVLSTVLSFFVFLAFMYYGAYFTAKGWNR
jgi:hypothetical protein